MTVNLNPANQNEYSIILEVFRIALINGLIDKREIIDWADMQIMKENEPDIGSLNFHYLRIKVLMTF